MKLKIGFFFFLPLSFSLQAMEQAVVVINGMAIDDNMVRDALSDTVFRYHVGKKLEAACHAFAEKVAHPTDVALRNIQAYKQKKLQKAIRVAQKERNSFFKFAFIGLGGVAASIWLWFSKRKGGWEEKAAIGLGLWNAYCSSQLFRQALTYKKPTMADISAKLLNRIYQPYDGKKILQKKVNDDPKFWLYLNINYQFGRTNNN